MVNSLFFGVHCFMHTAVLCPCHEKHRHTRTTSSKDELGKSTARRHRMSLNVWLKLMDCLRLLCPCPRLLPRSSHLQRSLSFLIFQPKFPLLLLVFQPQTTLFTPSFAPSFCFYASECSSTEGGINVTATRQMYTQCTHARVGDRLLSEVSMLKKKNKMKYKRGTKFSSNNARFPDHP